MPVHQFVNDATLQEKGLSNYWGYNTIAFLAPQNTYSSTGSAASRCRSSRRWCGRSTPPASRSSSTSSTTTPPRGITSGRRCRCAASTTRRTTTSRTRTRGYYTDYTGTGNSLNVRHPHTLQLIMDSLRYWVLEMHVDGFRFDLASTLAREFYEVDRLATFFELVQQDPVVSQVKLIAEPWDVGPGGYQVGNFPPQWTEWNGKYRDTVRDFWRGEGAVARRVRVAPDRVVRPVRALRAPPGRPRSTSSPRTTASRCATSSRTTTKHNEANGEDSRDGRIAQPVVELRRRGADRRPEDPDAPGTAAAQLHRDAAAVAGRADAAARRRARPHPAAATTTATRRTARLTWVDWDAVDQPLVEFTAALARLRKEHPTFRRSRFFDGRPVKMEEGAPIPDIVWLRPDGTVMQPEDWDSGFGRAIGVFLNGGRHPGARPPRRADQPTGTSSCCSTRATSRIDFHIPDVEFSPNGMCSSTPPVSWPTTEPVEPGATISLEAKSLVVLAEHKLPEADVDHSVAASLTSHGVSHASGRPSRPRRRNRSS